MIPMDSLCDSSCFLYLIFPYSLVSMHVNVSNSSCVHTQSSLNMGIACSIKFGRR